MDWKAGYPMGPYSGRGACYDSALHHCPDVLCLGLKSLLGLCCLCPWDLEGKYSGLGEG